MGAEVLTVLNSTKNTVLGDQIQVADTSLSRLVGLLGKRALEPGSGLLIIPSQAIHTVAMRFAIDVVFLDRDWRVIYLYPKIVPYRMTGIHWKARSVLELPVGIISQSSTSVGDQLSLEN
jgi:uncharacterized membrane protein (UPF0127 family)